MIAELVLAVLSSGLVTTLLTLRASRRKASAEAKSVEIDNARKLLEDFDSYIVEPLKQKVNGIRKNVAMLQDAIEQVADCPHRGDCPVAERLDELHYSLQGRTQSNSQESVSRSDSEMSVGRTMVYGTAHQVVTETLWSVADSVGRLYPRVTRRKEVGASREARNDVVLMTRDTVYVSLASVMSSQSEVGKPSATVTWVPWVIIGLTFIAVVIVAVVVVIVMVRR